MIGQLFLLLGRNNCDCILREIVAAELKNQLNEQEYNIYASQLIHATKWDYHPFNPLFRLLIQKAIEHKAFAYVLYWQLQVTTNVCF